ncbi:MAG: alginate export family protein [Acidobacteriota bacterium]
MHLIRLLVEIQDSRTFIDREILYSSSIHINEIDFLQAQLQFNLNLPSKMKSQFILGRFTMDLGKRRLSARNRMRNSTNAFEGISWTLTGKTDWMIRAFLTRPVLIDPYDLDSSDNRYFWGIFFESRHLPNFNMDLYCLGLHSNEQDSARPRHSTVGGRFYKMPETGIIDYEVESAWQFGKNESLDHLAYFQHGEIGYSINASWNPRLSFQYDYASGDQSPQDDRSGRFNTLFGARRFDFSPTGSYGPFSRSNLNTPGIRLVLNPLKELQIMASHRTFWLASARDAWAGSGLQDSTGSSGTSLGQNFETRIRWQSNSHLMIESGYARFFKGSYLELVPDGPRTGDSNFFYISVEIKAQFIV